MLEGDKGARTVPAAEFFVPPTEDPERENRLPPGEVLTEIRVPPASGMRSAYRDVRERQGFDWPLVSAAVALTLEASRVRAARIVLGAVAPIPWRASAAERALTGRALDAAGAEAAAAAAVEGAAPLSDNAYKVELVRTLVRRTLLGLA